MGDAAGGGLCLSITQQVKTEGWKLAERLVLLSPWLDVALNNPEIAGIAAKDVMLAREGLVEAGKMWATEEFPTDHPYISPIHLDLQLNVSTS